MSLAAARTRILEQFSVQFSSVSNARPSLPTRGTRQGANDKGHGDPTPFLFVDYTWNTNYQHHAHTSNPCPLGTYFVSASKAAHRFGPSLWSTAPDYATAARPGETRSASDVGDSWGEPGGGMPRQAVASAALQSQLASRDQHAVNPQTLCAMRTPGVPGGPIFALGRLSVLLPVRLPPVHATWPHMESGTCTVRPHGRRSIGSRPAR